MRPMLRGTLMTIGVLLFLALALIAQAVWGWGAAAAVAAVGLALYVALEVVPRRHPRPRD